MQLRDIVRRVRARRAPAPLDSAEYWETRYRGGGTSGPGSSGRLAAFKAEVLNRLVAEHGVVRVLELGCGDGQQLAMATYPEYLGVDVSETALAACRSRFADDPTKQFRLVSDRASWPWTTADLVLSVDVIFHLVEDEVYENYMRDLVRATEKLLVIYSSDVDAPGSAPHVRHRRFSSWLAAHAPHLQRIELIPNPFPARPGEETEQTSFCDFHVFEVG